MVGRESATPARIGLVMDNFEKVKCLFCYRCHTHTMYPMQQIPLVLSQELP